jgi:hypothetical protein
MCADGLVDCKDYLLDGSLARLCKSVTALPPEAANTAVMAELVASEQSPNGHGPAAFRRLPAAAPH